MPQLNPNPWFFILTLSWLIFSLIMQPKISSFTSTNQPANKTRTTTKTSPWPWPWT